MSAETVIATLRHARTRYNDEQRYAGSVDVPLSAAGVREARRAAPQVASWRFEVLVTSGMRRTAQTARLLGGPRARIVPCALCNERCFGILENRRWAEVRSIRPRILLIRVGDDWHTVNPPGAEPFEAVWERAKKFRRFLFREFAGRRVLVISHGVFLQMFHGLLRGVSCIEALARYPGNLELNVFRFAGRRLAQEQTVKLASGAGGRF